MNWHPRKNTDPSKPPIFQRRLRIGRLVLIAVFAFAAVFGLTKLIRYGVDLMASRRSSANLQVVYHSLTDDGITITPAPALTIPPLSAAAATPAPDEAPASTPVPALTAAPVNAAEKKEDHEEEEEEYYLIEPTQSPIPSLDAVPYPHNPKVRINSRFRVLRKSCRHAVGWLTVADLVDEAVVQKDNEFFLDHDAFGRKNVNGAIFLDAAVDLKSRPYGIIIYGHNMKTGAMFGGLRNFENVTFYRKSPFITFDTMYEEGRYVIFSVGQICVNEDSADFVDFFSLLYRNIDERQDAISTLKKCSVYSNDLDVQPSDQLLLLVTCVDNDNYRRVVAARRIRDGESENDLKKLVEQSKRR